MSKNGKIYLNEINTLPGFTPSSMYPKLWSVSRLNYKTLITDLVMLGLNNKEIMA
ncbi:hypothetical protein KAI92_01285 [Candidatus Parcubacteria bacterium]|nr:hypothetical protein [Candidatus Parcubacteria bacterium]